MAICDRCATESPSGFRFCGACGAQLPARDLDREVRKVVTLLFCDVVGSTSLGEQLDPEALHDVLGRYFNFVATIIEGHGGRIQKFAGDAVLAAFGIPRIREDDALRAVRAAAEIRERIPVLAGQVALPLTVRIGVNTGTVLSDEGRNLALGDAVNLAARLEQAALPGQILLGPTTHQLVRHAAECAPLPPLALPGKAERVTAHRLVRLAPGTAPTARRHAQPLVNRTRELAALHHEWKRAVAEPELRRVTLLGGAGAGKSRVAEEFLSEIGDTPRKLRGSCLPYGEGITFRPLLQALADVAEASGVLRRLTGGQPATPAELFLEVRLLLEELAASRPMVLHLDDLQWAEPMLMDLIAHLVELSREAPILLLCTARPELLDDHPGWAAPRANAATIELGPLEEREAELLLAQTGPELAAEARAHIVRLAGGNPLFLEEMAVLATEQGSLEVPPTIQALLAARVDQLPAREAELLTVSAVEGQGFHRSTLRALSGLATPADLDASLASLVRKNLIVPEESRRHGDAAYRFRHLLIRDAAYERLSKASRAELHGRLAALLDESSARQEERDEIVGYHLEQSALYRRELRTGDEDSAAAAADRLYAAGRRARERSDSAAARSLLERAHALLPPEDPRRARAGIALAACMVEAGDLVRADELLGLYEGGGVEADAAALTRLEWMALANPSRGKRMIESELPAILERLARDGDRRGQAIGHWLAFLNEWIDCQATRAGREARISAEHARAAGDLGLWSRSLGWYVAPLIFGPADAGTMARELESIEAQEPGEYLHGCVELGWAEVERLRGRIEPARRLAAQARARFRALGMHAMSATADQSTAAIERSAGDLPAALRALERSDAIFSESLEGAMRSTTQALLARARLEAGDPAGAREAAELSERLSAASDRSNQALTHGVRARLALAAGDAADAERWARSAVAEAARTDFPISQADAHLVLAHVLGAAGARSAASETAGAALSLYALKGDNPGATAAERQRRELSPA